MQFSGQSLWSCLGAVSTVQLPTTAATVCLGAFCEVFCIMCGTGPQFCSAVCRSFVFKHGGIRTGFQRKWAWYISSRPGKGWNSYILKAWPFGGPALKNEPKVPSHCNEKEWQKRQIPTTQIFTACSLHAPKGFFFCVPQKIRKTNSFGQSRIHDFGSNLRQACAHMS